MGAFFTGLTGFLAPIQGFLSDENEKELQETLAKNQAKIAKAQALAEVQKFKAEQAQQTTLIGLGILAAGLGIAAIVAFKD